VSASSAHGTGHDMSWRSGRRHDDSAENRAALCVPFR
jgi:hypothetical protein